MKFHRQSVAKGVISRPVAGAIAGFAALTAVLGGVAGADPVEDSVANVNELSREAERLSEAILNAQPNLDAKMQELAAADSRHSDDLARLEVTTSELATQQQAVDGYAAASYMGGQTGGVGAILTASSPEGLIDDLVLRRVMGAKIAEQMNNFRRADQDARAIETASAQSAAQAKAAVDQAVAFRADLQGQREELRTKMAAVNASYAALPAAQQAGLILPSAAVTQALGPIAPIPTVGMAGVVPAARALADYIMATYPGVESIGGVRADPLPDHPSGHAIDIMIGSNMALGDAIHADLENQAARFDIKYTMWRVAAHFNHVHVTVN